MKKLKPCLDHGMGGQAVPTAVQLSARADQPGQAAAPPERNGGRPPGPPVGERRGQVPRGQRSGGLEAGRPRHRFPRLPRGRGTSTASCITEEIPKGSGSVADPGSGAFLTPGSGIRNSFFSGSRISDPGSQTYSFESLVTMFWVKSSIIL